MRKRTLRYVCPALLSLALVSAVAQGRPGGPPPPPPPQAGGMPSGPGMNPAAQNPHGGGNAGAGAPRHDAQHPAGPAANSLTARPGVQFGPVGRWWDDKSVVRSVGLSNDQQRRMDTIFNASKPAILASYQTYLKEQAKLTALSRDPQATEATTFAAIDSVNQARAALQKATAQMYMQLRQQMKPEQIQKLEKLE